MSSISSFVKPRTEAREYTDSMSTRTPATTVCPSLSCLTPGSHTGVEAETDKCAHIERRCRDTQTDAWGRDTGAEIPVQRYRCRDTQTDAWGDCRAAPTDCILIEKESGMPTQAHVHAHHVRASNGTEAGSKARTHTHHAHHARTHARTLEHQDRGRGECVRGAMCKYLQCRPCSQRCLQWQTDAPC